jgi:hypothetical protein
MQQFDGRFDGPRFLREERDPALRYREDVVECDQGLCVS